MFYTMMKNITFVTLLVVTGVCAGCKDNGYTINGTVDNKELNGKYVYKVDGKSISEDMTNPKRDSAVISNGKYAFKGEVINPDYCIVFIEPDSPNDAPAINSTVVLERGEINIHTDADNETKVSGTPLNDSYQSYKSEYGGLVKAMRESYNILDKVNKKEMELSEADLEKRKQEISGYSDKIISLNRNYVKDNINNPAVWQMDLPSAVSNEESIEGKKDIISGADEYTKSLRVYKRISEQISTLEQTSVGNAFTDFTMEDPDGNTVSLSDYVGKGKYVLVDFWASWCGPCRHEMPTVVEAYNRFSHDDFEIVGVSLDGNKDEWLKAINDMNLSWKQMSDLKAWNCEGSKKYGVNGIPATVLFDRDGIIIARDLRGKELLSKLEELLR